jgi:hypothetical protein
VPLKFVVGWPIDQVTAVARRQLDRLDPGITSDPAMDD